MTDIREQILESKPGFFYTVDTVYNKDGVKEAMDEYAIKILQWLSENGQDFSSLPTEHFDAKKYLEEIKTELNENEGTDNQEPDGVHRY